VHFTGVEYYLTGRAAYDLVDRYAATAAPAQVEQIRAHLRPLRPTVPYIFTYIGIYRGIRDKGPYLAHAHALYDLVAHLPHRAGDRQHAIALHTVRQIVSFYEHFSLSDAKALVYRDAHAAANLRWWRGFTGDRIAYWAATPHTANAPHLRIATPGGDLRFASAGSYLRRWYGAAYRSIGFTFDHGTVLADGGQVVLPPPRPGWFEQPLGTVGLEQFALDLRRTGPASVRRWLDAPITTRGLPDAGPESVMDGGTPRQWFDVIIHRQVVTPAAG
jgi:erythromycin esterase-like protein